MRNLIIYMLLSIAGAALYGCASDECLGNHNALPKAGFYSSFSPAQSIAPADLTIGGVDAPDDSLIVDESSSTLQCYLPFRIDTPQTQYRISCSPDSTTTLSDVITFDYDIEPFFVNPACGAVYNFKINSISFNGTLVDSVACASPVITYKDMEYLRIYLHLPVNEP